jgi:hypothetical protein
MVSSANILDLFLVLVTMTGVFLDVLDSSQG